MKYRRIISETGATDLMNSGVFPIAETGFAEIRV